MASATSRACSLRLPGCGRPGDRRIADGRRAGGGGRTSQAGLPGNTGLRDATGVRGHAELGDARHVQRHGLHPVHRFQRRAREPDAGRPPMGHPLAGADEHLLRHFTEPIGNAHQDGCPRPAETVGQHSDQPRHPHLRRERALSARQRPLGQLGEERAEVLAGRGLAQRERAHGRTVRAAGPLDALGAGQPGGEQGQGRLVQLAQDRGGHFGSGTGLGGEVGDDGGRAGRKRVNGEGDGVRVAVEPDHAADR
ncbi:hypothetical protein [Nonomuraea sp. NPDC049784]|uniref:hypothetical protein n=1 Tax=Nonomuraea sp. NPDC049784 TaxID=3154361 RepID=UPI0033F7EE5B